MCSSHEDGCFPGKSCPWGQDFLIHTLQWGKRAIPSPQVQKYLLVIANGKLKLNVSLLMMRECLIHVHFAYWQKEKDECWKENQGKCTAAAKYNDDRMSSQPAHAPDPVSGAGWLAASWLALNTGFLANASLSSPRFLFLLHLTSLCHQLSHFSTNAKPSMPKWIWPFEQLVLVCLSPKPRFAFQSWPCRLLFSATGTSGASHRWNYQTNSFVHFAKCTFWPRTRWDEWMSTVHF